jgi:ABC-type branched-subunit amino acid transport system substrate-binding protein
MITSHKTRRSVGKYGLTVLVLMSTVAACGSDKTSVSTSATAATMVGSAAPAETTAGSTAATTAPSTAHSTASTTAGTGGTSASASGYDWSGVDMSNVTITIGQILPLTGGAASYADLFESGSDLAAEQIKAAGGPTIKFDRVDNVSGTPESAITAARQLVSDGVPIAQTSFPEASIAIVPVIDDAKLLTFNPAGATPEQLGAGKYLWMGGPDGAAPLPLMADYVNQTDKTAKKAGIIVWNTATAIQGGKDIGARWESLGGTVTATEQVDIGAADVGTQVSRILSDKPDTIFLELFGQDNANVIKAIRDKGFTGTIVGSEYDPQFHAFMGTADENFVAITYALDPTLDQPFNRLFIDGYAAKYGHNPESFSSMFYENTWLIADLAVRAVRAGDDPTKKESLFNAFMADPSTPTSIIGVPYKWDATTHGYSRPFVIGVVHDGKDEAVGLIEGQSLELGKTLADLGR